MTAKREFESQVEEEVDSLPGLATLFARWGDRALPALCQEAPGCVGGDQNEIRALRQAQELRPCRWGSAAGRRRVRCL